MEIMVLPDGESYAALEGCTIRRVPDALGPDEVEALLDAGGGEILARLHQDPARAPKSAEEGRPFTWPGRVWLANVSTKGPPEIEVLYAEEGAAARAMEVYEAFFSAAAVAPLREALERFAEDPDLAADLARDALARFRAMTGQRRRRA